jgi:hypothetical protein
MVTAFFALAALAATAVARPPLAIRDLSAIENDLGLITKYASKLDLNVHNSNFTSSAAIADEIHLDLNNLNAAFALAASDIVVRILLLLLVLPPYSASY